MFYSLACLCIDYASALSLSLSHSYLAHFFLSLGFVHVFDSISISVSVSLSLCLSSPYDFLLMFPFLAHINYIGTHPKYGPVAVSILFPEFPEASSVQRRQDNSQQHKTKPRPHRVSREKEEEETERPHDDDEEDQEGENSNNSKVEEGVDEYREGGQPRKKEEKGETSGEEDAIHKIIQEIRSPPFASRSPPRPAYLPYRHYQVNNTDSER